MSDRKLSGELTLLGEDYEQAMFRDRTELRNCPFCGASPVTYGKRNEETGFVVYTAKCPNIKCDAEINACMGNDAEESRTEVVKRWNTRAKNGQ